MKKVAVIGANEFQFPLVEKINKLVNFRLDYIFIKIVY